MFLTARRRGSKKTFVTVELFEFFCQIVVQAPKKHFIAAAMARPAAARTSLKVMQSCLSVYCILLNQTFNLV